MAHTGDRIRAIREKRGLTQDQLADKAKISTGFLSDVENGKRNVSSENLLKIANALGASADYLLRGETRETNQRQPVVKREDRRLLIVDRDDDGKLHFASQNNRLVMFRPELAWNCQCAKGIGGAPGGKDTV